MCYTTAGGHRQIAQSTTFRFLISFWNEFRVTGKHLQAPKTYGTAISQTGTVKNKIGVTPMPVVSKQSNLIHRRAGGHRHKDRAEHFHRWSPTDHEWKMVWNYLKITKHVCKVPKNKQDHNVTQLLHHRKGNKCCVAATAGVIIWCANKEARPQFDKITQIVYQKEVALHIVATCSWLKNKVRLYQRHV